MFVFRSSSFLLFRLFRGQLGGKLLTTERTEDTEKEAAERGASLLWRLPETLPITLDPLG